MVQALIFDLGNVLLFFDQEKMVRQIASVCDLPSKDVHNILLEKNLSESYELGKISSSDICALLEKRAKRSLDFKKLLHAGSNIFEPNALLIAHLPRFKEQGLRLILLSNTVDMHFDYIEKHTTFLHHFDHLILSYKVGARKPEAKIYEMAIDAAKRPKERCLFIDDRIENVEGARNVGLNAHHFTHTQALLEHLTHV